MEHFKYIMEKWLVVMRLFIVIEQLQLLYMFILGLTSSNMIVAFNATLIFTPFSSQCP